MSTVVSTSEVRLKRGKAGVLTIGGSRVPLDTVIMAFSEGATPEEIVQDYDSLKLSEVYAVISYYLQNRDKVTKYLARRKVESDKVRRMVEDRCEPSGLRQRLLARQTQQD